MASSLPRLEQQEQPARHANRVPGVRLLPDGAVLVRRDGVWEHTAASDPEVKRVDVSTPTKTPEGITARGITP